LVAVTREQKAVTDARVKDTSATKLQTDAQHAYHSALRGVGGALGNLWLTYGRFASVMAATYAAVTTVQGAFKQGLELSFQSTMATTLSAGGEDITREQVKKVREDLYKVTTGTIYSAPQAADALAEMARAGIQAHDGIAMMNTVMNAALFGQTDLKESSIALTTAMNNFGLMSTDAAKNAENIKRVVTP
jgi:hypothetical protein